MLPRSASVMADRVAGSKLAMMESRGVYVSLGLVDREMMATDRN